MSATICPTVGTAALDAYEADLVALKLAQRDGLPKAANGRPMAPSDAYARRVLKDIGAEKSHEYRRLLATDLCALHDGVPLPIVKQPLRRYEAILDTATGDYRPRAMVALHRAETRAQGLLDLAQLRTAENDDDLDALERQSAEIEHARATLDELAWETNRRIAVKLASQAGATTHRQTPSNGPDRAAGHLPSRGPLVRLK